MHKSGDCFREALKTVVKSLEDVNGKTVKTDLAAKVNVSPTHFRDLESGRKVGSEDLRRRIAETLGFNYCAFIELGRLLLQGYSLIEAKKQILDQPASDLPHDDKLNGIISFWPELTVEQQDSLHGFLKEFLFQNWKHYKFIRQHSGKSSEVFYQIWKLTCDDFGQKIPFSKSTFSLIKDCNMDYATIYFEARNYVEAIKAGKLSDKP